MKIYKKKSEKGASLVEYGMLAGLVSVVSISAVVGLGEKVENTFSSSAASIAVVDEKIQEMQAPEPMILQFNAAQATVTPNGGGAISIDWGDDAANASCGQDFTASGPITCAGYPSAGTYQVSITGAFPQYGPGNSTTNAGLTGVVQWGETGINNLSQAFRDATSLVDLPRDLPATVTTLNQALKGASSFNDPDISNWDTGNVNRFTGLFYDASSFNQDLPWNMANADSLNETFRGASVFDGDLSTWQTGQFTNLDKTFQSASNFTGKGLSGWDTSEVRDLTATFASATSFNADISNWDTSKVTKMPSMFSGASVFNRDLIWDVTKVTSMSNMFKNASVFDQDIKDWCASLVPSKPTGFDEGTGAGFVNNAAKQPQWGCTAP